MTVGNVGINQLTDDQYMPDALNKAHAGKIFHVVCTYFTHIQFGVNLYICVDVEDICDMFIQISGYL